MSSYGAPVMSCPLLMGKTVHAHGPLSRGSCSEGNTEVNALIASFITKREMAAPGAHCDNLHQVLQCAFMLSQPGYVSFKTCIERNIYSKVKYIKCVQEYIQECIRSKALSLFT